MRLALSLVLTRDGSSARSLVSSAASSEKMARKSGGTMLVLESSPQLYQGGDWSSDMAGG